MKWIQDKYLHTTIHDFKTHFSDYLRQMEAEHIRAVIVYRRNKKAGIFIPYEARMREAKSGMEPYS